MTTPSPFRDSFARRSGALKASTASRSVIASGQFPVALFLLIFLWSFGNDGTFTLVTLSGSIQHSRHADSFHRLTFDD
jgi:hypothetical protein